jgi:hypothetical protein
VNTVTTLDIKQPPRVQGWDSETVLTNVAPKLIKIWNDLPHPKLFVYPWEAGYQADASDTVHWLSSAIANLLGIPKPAVGAPLAAAHSTQRFAAPWCFLVTKLSVEAVEILINQQYWSTPTTTFIAIPFTPRISPYVVTIENFTFTDSEAEEVLDVVKQTINECEQAKEHVASCDPDPHAFQHTLNTTQVKQLRLGIPNRAGGGTKLVWNVYINPPSQDPPKQREWRKILSSLTFLTALNGAGVALPSTMDCSGCKSIDHPAGLCPIPQTLGWPSYRATTSTDIPTSLTQALSTTTTTRSRGSRGRGPRGRGNVRGLNSRGSEVKRGYL